MIQAGLDGPDQAAAYAEGVRQAARAIETLAQASSPAAAAQIRVLGDRLRRLFGVRETPKFTLVRVLGLTREALLASGADLVAAGRLVAAEDVAFCHLHELAEAFDTDVDLVSRVEDRKVLRDREARRAQVPVVLLGDGRSYASAPGGGEADLRGSGVRAARGGGGSRRHAPPRHRGRRHGRRHDGRDRPGGRGDPSGRGMSARIAVDPPRPVDALLSAVMLLSAVIWGRSSRCPDSSRVGVLVIRRDRALRVLCR